MTPHQRSSCGARHCRAVEVTLRRTASRQRNRTAGRTTAESVSAPLALDWTDADVEKVGFEWDTVRSRRRHSKRKASDALVFTQKRRRITSRCRVPTLPPCAGSTLSVRIDCRCRVARGMTCAAPTCRIRVIHLLSPIALRCGWKNSGDGCGETDVTGIRVYFQSAARQPISASARIRVVEHR